MANRQIEEVRNREAYPLTQRARARSLPAQVSAVVLQPVYFFRTLTDLQNTRQWLWIGIVILLLTGFSAVQQQAMQATSAPPTGGFTGGPDFGGGGMDFGGVPPGFGGPPPDSGAPVGGGATTSGIAATWTTALIAATRMIVIWGVLTLLLCEVSLFNGAAPRLGHNFQVAVWSSIPLGIMAALQLLYYGGGGMPGQPGLAGLVGEIPNYSQLPQFVRSLLLSFASSLTIFWLWSLVLTYYGARFALHGKRWASLLVVVIWVIVLVFTPVLTGAISAPETEAPPTDDFTGFDRDGMGGPFPDDMGQPGGDDVPGGLGAPLELTEEAEAPQVLENTPAGRPVSPPTGRDSAPPAQTEEAEKETAP